MEDKEKTASIFVALMGAPNAGKSTFVNQLVGSKISIVTHKVQTTRRLVRGISLFENTQIIFIDTPGIFAPKRRLDRAMVSAAWSAAKDADMLFVLIDASIDLNEENKKLLKAVQEIKKPGCLILNKIDQMKHSDLLALSQTINDLCAFDETFMISALKGSGCQDVLKYLAKKAIAGPWYYNPEQISDLPLRQLAAEITREKLYLRLHEELPYSSTVETEGWEQFKDGSVKISQVIYVERDNQKKIILGKDGAVIKAIGKAARQELMQLLEQKVHLFLYVKVRENWMNDPNRYEEIGLDFL